MKEIIKKYLTSESVTEGHPDKVCDKIADTILDAYLAQDKNAHVACEVVATTNFVLVMGEVTANAKVDVEKKVMISGYCSIEFENEALLYDYEGVGYPEGTLLKNNTISFNSADIIEIIHEGYRDDDFNLLNETLNKDNSEIETLED